METYFYHQNPGWGSLAGQFSVHSLWSSELTATEVEQKKKVLEFILPKTVPVPGFAAALRKLHALGHPLHIVTARPEKCRPQMTEWLAEHGIGVGFGDDDVVAALWFTHGFGLPASAAGGEVEKKEVSNEKLNAELQEMFKQSVGQGSSGKKKLKVSQLSFVQVLTGRSSEPSTQRFSSTTTTGILNQS